MAAERERSHDLLGLASQQNRISGFACKISTGANGESGISLRKRRRVVNPIAHHGDSASSALQFADFLQLGSRQQLRVYLVNTHLARDFGRGGTAVSG
jgi:hypothetical protein